jgi:hypothetical protein
MDLSCECDCDCEAWAERIAILEDFLPGVGPIEYERQLCVRCHRCECASMRRPVGANPWRQIN